MPANLLALVTVTLVNTGLWVLVLTFILPATVTLTAGAIRAAIFAVTFALTFAVLMATEPSDHRR